MKKIHPLLLALASGLLLSLGWPPLPFSPLLFVGFIPLFWLLEQGCSRGKFFGLVYLAMLVWNIITTWWMWNSTAEGAVAAMVVNCLLMCLPWLLLYNTRKRLGEKWSYIAFAGGWLSFEYIHLNWELSWPWLTLGNGFASAPALVQWYEFTGASGGSLWILSANILLFRLLLAYARNRKFPRRLFLRSLLPLLLAPVLLSLLIHTWRRPLSTPTPGAPQVLIVQPNIDPYMKFEAGTQQAQLDKLIRLSEQGITPQTRLVVWPETAINLPNGIEEDSIRKNYLVRPVWDFLARHPQLKLFSGIEGYRLYHEEGKSLYARRIQNTSIWYDTYNTAALLDSTGILNSYHKSKLVPGVESLPSFLAFMGPWFEQFGGTTGGYARQKERTVLTDPASGLAIAPAICYESIYGEFMTGFLRNGANLVCVITNDGWWGNTAGHKQHLAYARLRAIEGRRWVVRSANTGISALIDPLGATVACKGWDEMGFLAVSVPPLDTQTFYARFGDWISKIALVLTVVLAGWSFSRLWRSVKK